MHCRQLDRHLYLYPLPATLPIPPHHGPDILPAPDAPVQARALRVHLPSLRSGSPCHEGQGPYLSAANAHDSCHGNSHNLVKFSVMCVLYSCSCQECEIDSMFCSCSMSFRAVAISFPPHLHIHHACSFSWVSTVSRIQMDFAHSVLTAASSHHRLHFAMYPSSVSLSCSLNIPGLCPVSYNLLGIPLSSQACRYV